MKKNTLKIASQVWFFPLLVIILWGLVPSLAKLGNLAGGLTTMYVNWFAVLGVIFIMALTDSFKEFSGHQPYRKMVMLGLIWPFAYSILYFTSINTGSGSMTTIANYSWPVFYLLLALLIFRKKFSPRSWIVVLLAVLGVAVPAMLAGNFSVIILPLALGLLAALFQALYSLLTEKMEQNAWLITFVVEVVTAVGSTVYVLLFERFVFPSWETLTYLAFIGIFSNGIGFWAFLRASQESARMGTHAKTVFLVLMCLTPLVQVILLPLLGIEAVSPEKWLGIWFITGALALYRLFPTKEESAAAAS